MCLLCSGRHVKCLPRILLCVLCWSKLVFSNQCTGRWCDLPKATWQWPQADIQPWGAGLLGNLGVLTRSGRGGRQHVDYFRKPHKATRQKGITPAFCLVCTSHWAHRAVVCGVGEAQRLQSSHQNTHPDPAVSDSSEQVTKSFLNR